MTCVHRWRIDSPNGPYSCGRCKLCGAEQQFPNSAREDRASWAVNGAGVMALRGSSLPRRRTGAAKLHAPAERLC